MINIKTVLMLSVSCLTFLAAKEANANINYNINSIESNLDTKHSPRFWNVNCQGKTSAGEGIMTNSCEDLGIHNTMFCDRFNY